MRPLICCCWILIRPLPNRLDSRTRDSARGGKLGPWLRVRRAIAVVYFNCKATTSKKKRRKRKQKDQKTASSDSRSWRLARLGSHSCSPAVQHTDHYETRQQQIMQINTRQKILLVWTSRQPLDSQGWRPLWLYRWRLHFWLAVASAVSPKSGMRKSTNVISTDPNKKN